MTPAARFALRRVAVVWLVVALVEGLLWWLLHGNNYYRPLWRAPALLMLVMGVLGTLHALRVRHGDRRGGDRRGDARRAAGGASAD